jgi:hypothetical protein
MSTYLKTAAMSLLSRTLQTFLSKYLSDVDVEGVALPSVYDGSGWGVRLSNVKLREGVQLMKQMPGTITKKRKRRRKRRKESTTTRQTKDPSSDGRLSSEKLDYKKNTSSPADHRVGGGGDSLRQQGKQTSNTKRTPGTDHCQGSRPKAAAEEAAANPESAAEPKPTSRDVDSADVYTDDEIDYDSDGVARPSTPVQESKSFLSCFYNSSSGTARSKLNDNSVHTGAKDSGRVSGRLSHPSLTDSPSSLSNGGIGLPKRQSSEATSSIQPLKKELMIKEGESGSPVTDVHTDSSSTQGDSNLSASQIPPLPLVPAIHQDYQGKETGHHDEESDSLDDEYEEDENEEEYELPLRLCLGEGGRIGTLDVRLIGKELHVMVEDAFVTIEAIPILESDPDYGDSAGGANADGNDSGSGGANRRRGEGSQQNGSATTSSDTASGTNASNPKKKAEAKRDTVGDRVLADNPLARLISSIPHLFLRDIRVRLIVRDQAMPTPREDGDKSAAGSTDKGDQSRSSRSRPSAKDTMVELGIDFLSVTSGEDVLSHFSDQVDEEFHSSLDDINSSERSSMTVGQSKPPPLLNIPTYARADSTTMVDQTNEYLVRHIRTGRGPTAGIFVQIFAADVSLPKPALSQNHFSNPDSSLWARQHWMLATEYHFLKCSGLDIRARIHLGTRKVDAGYSWFYGEFMEEEGTDYDSMILLGGMDTIAPGPQLPLPPMEPRMSRGSTPRQNAIDSGTSHGVTDGGGRESLAEEFLESAVPSSMHPGADVYETDNNGIQSCRVPSLFHRVSRGMEPKSCKDCKHLPSGVCDLCWGPSNGDVKERSELDLSLPMPGLALQIGFRDPLEINIDRSTLESISLLKSLFMKPNPSDTKDSSEQESSSREETKDDPPPSASAAIPGRDEATQTTTASTGFFSGLLYSRSKEIIKAEVPSDSFSTIMEPEKIMVVGLYASKVAIRIHVMTHHKRDRSLSFCFWSLDMDCLTVDRQTLNVPNKLFQDVELDIGRLVWDEFRGTNRKNVVTLGLPQPSRGRCDSQSSKSSMIEDHERNKTPWPSTACALLDIPPPLESLVYKSRERHGVQLRFVSLSRNDTPLNASKSLINLRLGVTYVDSPWKVTTDINFIVKEIMDHLIRARGVGGKDKEDSPRSNDNGSDSNGGKLQNSTENSQETAVVPRPKSLMTYTIQIDTGNITLSPLLDLKLPLTKFSGERSSEAGIFLETVLEKLELAYGSTESKTVKGCLSLPQIAALPESARMHILFCLKDLSALETALFVKKEKNSFRQIRAVEKGILKMAKKISKKDSKISKRKSNQTTSFHNSASSISSGDRRQQILSEIMKLDDRELTELWAVHQRYQRKVAKKTI